MNKELRDYIQNYGVQLDIVQNYRTNQGQMAGIYTNRTMSYVHLVGNGKNLCRDYGGLVTLYDNDEQNVYLVHPVKGLTKMLKDNGFVYDERVGVLGNWSYDPKTREIHKDFWFKEGVGLSTAFDMKGRNAYNADKAAKEMDSSPEEIHIFDLK